MADGLGHAARTDDGRGDDGVGRREHGRRAGRPRPSSARRNRPLAQSASSNIVSGIATQQGANGRAPVHPEQLAIHQQPVGEQGHDQRQLDQVDDRVVLGAHLDGARRRPAAAPPPRRAPRSRAPCRGTRPRAPRPRPAALPQKAVPRRTQAPSQGLYSPVCARLGTGSGGGGCCCLPPSRSPLLPEGREAKKSAQVRRQARQRRRDPRGRQDQARRQARQGGGRAWAAATGSSARASAT